VTGIGQPEGTGEHSVVEGLFFFAAMISARTALGKPVRNGISMPVSGRPPWMVVLRWPPWMVRRRS